MLKLEKFVELEIKDVTIHQGKNTGKVYLRIKLDGGVPHSEILAFAAGFYGPGGRILLNCGITIDDEISGEDGERASIADRCIGKTVECLIGRERFMEREIFVVQEVRRSA